MTVCLHCGEIAPDGALFCTKCGYTLPQIDTSLPPVAPTAPPTAPPIAPVASPGMAPIAPRVSAGNPATYVVPAGATGVPTGPIPPPPSGKYCVRCRTVISRAAVYCPVCQQPQTP